MGWRRCRANYPTLFMNNTLVRVTGRDGIEDWVLVHVEGQGAHPLSVFKMTGFAVEPAAVKGLPAAVKGLICRCRKSAEML